MEPQEEHNEAEKGKRNMEKKPRWMAVIFFSRWVQEPVIWQRATSVTTERRARRKTKNTMTRLWELCMIKG